MSDDLTTASQLSWLVPAAISAGTAILVALVKRSVSEQDKKLDAIGTKVDAITERVGEHAAQLAEGKAEIKELARRAGALERQVYDVSIHGCAKACRQAGPAPRDE